MSDHSPHIFQDKSLSGLIEVKPEENQKKGKELTKNLSTI